MGGVRGRPGKTLYWVGFFNIIISEGGIPLRMEDNVTKEFLENLLNSLEGGVLAVDRNMRITAFNRAAEVITGLKREEVLNKVCAQVLKGELCKDECAMKEVMKTGEPVYSYEIIIQNKAGEKIPVNVSTSALRSGSNEIIGAVENFRDLTKQKGLWAKLREERKATFRKVMAGEEKEEEDYENTIITKSGEEKMVAWHNTTLVDEKGLIIGTLSSGEDITKRKETEVELIRAEKLTSLGQLAASVAHEVNNPLAGILVYTTLLLKKHQEKKLQTEETANQLLKMKKELERTSRIIRNLLDFSRQSDADMGPTEINKVVEAALLLVRHLISLENIKLEMKLGQDLPLVLAGFDQIQQVLINLLLNATQAMPEGGQLAVTTSLAKNIRIGEALKNTVRIDVTDTGVGIPRENLGKLFTPFFTTKEKGKGAGLGLPVVHGIIERHKGKIEVASEGNRGTTFTIYLEAMDGKEDDHPRR